MIVVYCQCLAGIRNGLIIISIEKTNDSNTLDYRDISWIGIVP